MKTVFFLILTLVIFSCKKDRGKDSTLTLTGTWDITFTYSRPSTMSGPMVITQHTDNSLSRTFDWGGGHYNLNTSSLINGNNATIDWGYCERFSGTVNTAFDYMQDEKSSCGYPGDKYTTSGTWTAIKSSK